MSRQPRLFFAEEEERIEMVECPNCGKHSLVAQTRDKYSCLNCNFRRDLSRPYVGKGAGDFFFGGIAGLGLLLLL